MTSCACKLAQHALEEDPDYDPSSPDDNSPAHERYQAAKELGAEWGCPNWKPVEVKTRYVSLPEHRLEALNDAIEPPKNKKLLAVIKGYEGFLKVPGEARGACYKTCPNFYQTKGSPLAPELEQVALHQRWFEKGQYAIVNPDPSQFDIESQDALMTGTSIVETHYNKKMKKENEDLRKQMEEERKKKK